MDRAGGIGEVVDLEPLGSARRPRHGSSAASGCATRVRRCGGTPRAAPRPGRSVAPKPPVIARLTSISAASIAGSKTDQDHRRELPAGDADLRQHEQRQEENDGSRQAKRWRHSPRCRSPRSGGATRDRAGGNPSERSKAATAAADQVIAGIALTAIAVARVWADDGDLQGARRAISGSREVGAAGHLLDGGAVEVAGGEIHGGESRCRRAGFRRPGSPPRTASPNRRRRSGACW